MRMVVYLQISIVISTDRNLISQMLNLYKLITVTQATVTSDVLTAVIMTADISLLTFRKNVLPNLYDRRGTTFLRNVDKPLPDYNASQY
jgi:hypothetical protein